MKISDKGRGNRHRHKGMASTTMREQVNKANQPEADRELCNTLENFILGMNALIQSINELKEESKELKKLKSQVEALQMKQKVQQLKIDTVTTMANKSIDLIEAL